MPTCVPNQTFLVQSYVPSTLDGDWIAFPLRMIAPRCQPQESSPLLTGFWKLWKCFTTEVKSVEYQLSTFQGSDFEYVSLQLINWVGHDLFFVPHVQQLMKNPKMKLGFFFRIKSCLSVDAKKRYFSAAFKSLLHLNWFICMLPWSFEVHHKSYHYTLYSRVRWSLVSSRRLKILA